MKIKLVYFDIEAAAEKVRLALTLSGADFEDVRVKFADWPAMKANMPYGQLPVLYIDDAPAKTQSGAMLRWVSTLNPSKSLYPSDKIYDVEEAIGLIDDMQRSFMPCLYLSMRPSAYGYPEDFSKTDQGKEKISSMRKSFIEQELPKYLNYISDMIDRNGGKWLVAGENPTLADCNAVPFLRSFTKGHVDYIETNCLDVNPKVVEYVKRFCALPEIKGRYTNGLGAADA